MRYLITFACYSPHLRGDESGSVDPRQNLYGSRTLEADPYRATAERKRMSDAPYTLESGVRRVVLEAIREVCAHRGWRLLAAHVRSNHVHVVVEAEARPEKMMSDFKAYATRALNRLEGRERRRWARHGSTLWLRGDENVREAIRYVVEEQGGPMAVFLSNVL